MGAMKKRERSVERGVVSSNKRLVPLSLFRFCLSMETTFWRASLRTVSPRIGSSEKSFLLRGNLTFLTLISEHSA